jgi:putative DNA primase/helicase
MTTRPTPPVDMVPISSIDRLLVSLTNTDNNVFQTGRTQWQAACPAHDDRVESLCFAVGRVVPIVMTCHAGCNNADVLNVLGLPTSLLSTGRPQLPTVHVGERGRVGRGGTASARPRGTVVATYDYTDADRRLKYQTVRYEPKAFRLRRPDERGGWAWNMKGVDRVLYRLPDVISAVQRDEPIYIAEGEKDADALRGVFVTATTAPQGARSWHLVADHARAVLSDATVIVVVDDDSAGHLRGADVARSLDGVVRSLVVVRPAFGKDAYDHIDAGYLVEQFVVVRR